MEPVRRRNIIAVPAEKLHLSTILPRRDSIDDEILKSVKSVGFLMPLIVRPLKENPEEYEIVDGSIRRLAFRNDQYVVVVVLYGYDDSEVFRIRQATFRRRPLTTYEKAELYSQWVRTVARERRVQEWDERGAQAWVARLAEMREGEISQYMAIYKMFTKLQTVPRSAAISLDALKNQSINKLYELSKLIGNPALSQVAQELAQHPNMPIRKLRHKVREKIATGKPPRRHANARA